MQAGLAGQDASLTSRAAHSLKGSSSNLGASRLASLCAAVEAQTKAGLWTGVPEQLSEIKSELALVNTALKEEIQVRPA
jgi:HPt (histidine-containing phosphotransfer) domain-containing protein